MSVVGSVGVKVLQLMILLVCLGWGSSSVGAIQATAQDAPVADSAPVAAPPASSENDGDGKTEETPGLGDLDKAFDLKINSKSTRDLDKVARLCEQAIEKGLNKAGEEQAKVLAKTAYYEHAQQLTARILPNNQQKPDPRWKPLRREALRRLAKAVEIDPEMASAYVLTAKLQRLPLGDKEKGKAAINRALSLIHDDDELMSEALMEKARLSDDILADAVMDDVDEAIRLNPANREARGLRSQLLMRSGKIEKAFEDLDAVLESAGNYNAYASQANQLMRNPSFAESEVMQNAALRYLDKAMELKSAPQLLLAKALALQAMDKPQEALAAIDQNLEADPENYKAFEMRATINADQGRIKKAIEDLDQALDIKPGEASILLQRMELHQRDENLDAAIADCERLSDMNKGGNFPLQMRMAQLYLGNNQPSKSIDVVDKMLKQYSEGVWDDLSPAAGYQITQRRLRALRMRGDCHLHTGDHQNAVDDYELGVDLTEIIAEFKRSLPRPNPPKLPDSIPEEARVEAMKRWNAMAEELDKEFIGDSGLLNNLAWVLATSPIEEVRDGERAIELATSAAEITEFKQAFILSTLASGYAESGDFEKAQEWSNKAIEVSRADLEAIKQNEDLEEEDREALIKIKDDQLISLKKELASYEMEKPWRERQTSEEEVEVAGEEGDTEGKDGDAQDESDGGDETPEESDAADEESGADEDGVN